MKKLLCILLCLTIISPAFSELRLQRGAGTRQNQGSEGKIGTYLFSDNGKVYRICQWAGNDDTALAVGNLVCYKATTAGNEDYQVTTPADAIFDRLAGVVAQLPLDGTGKFATSVDSGDEVLIQVKGEILNAVDLSTITNATIGYSLKPVNGAYTAAPDTAAGVGNSYPNTLYLLETATGVSDVDVVIDCF